MKLIIDYKTNKIYREEFFLFISSVFPSISFAEWYSKGFWTENYIPFSFLDSGKIVANASASIMEVLINGKKFNAVQIGAVGTLPEYRNKGLSRKLMNEVLQFYKDKTDLFFLYANDSVIDFYPKFGFEHKIENSFTRTAGLSNSTYSAKKLDIKDCTDYSLLINLLEKRKPLTKLFGAVNYKFITMWHIINLYSANLYYLEKENAVIIKSEQENKLTVIDVIFTNEFDLNSALPKIVESEKIDAVDFLFPPDQLKFSHDDIKQENTLLFVKGDVDLSAQPFRFPATAQT